MKRLIGHVGVDAGLIWVGDPCYVLGQDTPHAVESWDKFLEALAWAGHDAEGYSEPLGKDVGIAVHSGWGDGVYPVYADIDGHLIRSIQVVFDGDGNA